MSGDDKWSFIVQTNCSERLRYNEQLWEVSGSLNCEFLKKGIIQNQNDHENCLWLSWDI